MDNIGIVVLLIGVGLLVLGHLLWKNVERRRFLAAVQRLQQAGEPVLMDDFSHAAANDPNNPVPEWRAAAAAPGAWTAEMAASWRAVRSASAANSGSTRRALAVDRCLIRLGPHGDIPTAQWQREGLAPVNASRRLAVSNLAVKRRQTVALEDARTAPELDDASLGGEAPAREPGAGAPA